MPAQHNYNPRHLALAIALAFGYVEVSQAQQAETEVVSDAKITKPRKKSPKPIEPFDDIFAIKEFIGPLEHTPPTTNQPKEMQPITKSASVAVEFDQAFYELLDFPEPKVAEMEVDQAEENPFDSFKNAYTTQHSIISKQLQTIDGVALQMGEADDLVVINNGARWEGRIDGGGGDNDLWLNATEGGEIGETANFKGARVARGTWSLHHDFAGNTEVKSGASLVNSGSIKGDAYVDAGAVYGGNGNVNNLYVAGSIMASTASGSPLIKGDLIFAEGATFSYGVTADEFSPPVLVSGTAALEGAKFHVNGIPGDYADSTVKPVLSAGNIKGEFADVSSNLTFMTPTLTYSPTEVALTYKRNTVKLEQLAGSASGQALARSVDNPNTAAANMAVRALLHSDTANATSAIEQLAAGSNANLVKTTLSNDSPVSASMLSAMRQLDNRTGARPGSDKAPRLATDSQNGGRVWLQALGYGGKVDRDFDSTLKYATQGLVLGADWRIDQSWHVGVIGAKSQTRLDARQFDGDLDSWHLGAYAVRQDGPFSLRLGASYGSHDGSSKRKVAFNRFSDRPKGNYDASTQQAFAEVGFNLGRTNVSIEPFASLGIQRYQRDTYSEKGGAAALKVYGQTQENLSSTFGLRLAKVETLDNGMRLTPRFSAGWKHTYGELYTHTRQRLVTGGNNYTVYGAELDRNSLLVDAGLDLGVSAIHSVGVGLTGEAGSDGRSYGVMGQWRMAF